MDIIYLYLIVIGLMVGSFVNVFIYRWPKGEQWVSGRSRCMSCRHDLRWYDLVPVVSYLYLRGRCRYCDVSLSRQYPLIEIINALGWVMIWNFMMRYELMGVSGSCQISWINLELLNNCDWIGVVKLLMVLGLWSISLGAVVIDIKHLLLPDQLWLWMFGLSGFVVIWSNDPLLYVERLFGGGLGLLFFGSLHVFTKGRGMGLGDVKLAGGIGLLLGKYAIVSMLASFWIGSIVGLIMVLGKKARFGRQIPFGPFMILGLWMGLLFGHQLLDRYLSMMGW